MIATRRPPFFLLLVALLPSSLAIRPKALRRKALYVTSDAEDDNEDNVYTRRNVNSTSQQREPMPPCWWPEEMGDVDMEEYLRLDTINNNQNNTNNNNNASSTAAMTIASASKAADSAATLSNIACSGSTGKAGAYPCNKMDLLSMISASTFGSTLNDIWGWTDRLRSREYALVGLTTGMAVVDITNGRHPVYIGFLPRHYKPSQEEIRGRMWRDIKTYKNHAYIVSEIAGDGLQVFDLRQLRRIRLRDEDLPKTLVETAHYDGIQSAHNLYINEDTGRAFCVGGANDCSGGLHIVDIRNPIEPRYAGCYSRRGYTHDVQCVTYNGPDTTYVGRDICFASNQNKMDIIDVTRPRSGRFISSIARKDEFQYTHQGWLTEDHKYFFLCDELDEARLGGNTVTFILDVSDLDNPRYLGRYTQENSDAIDHNVFVKGNYVYLANYKAGLKILRMIDRESAGRNSQRMLEEVASFDFMPGDDGKGFDGAWGTYPFFDSDKVIVSAIHQGLFVVHPTPAAVPAGSLCNTCRDVMSTAQNRPTRIECRDTCRERASELEDREAGRGSAGGGASSSQTADKWRRVRRTCGRMCKWMKRQEEPLTLQRACSQAANCG